MGRDSDDEDLVIPIDRRGSPDSNVLPGARAAAAHTTPSRSPPPPDRNKNGSKADLLALAHTITHPDTKPKVVRSPAPGPGQLTQVIQVNNGASQYLRPDYNGKTNASNERFQAPPDLEGMDKYNPIRRRKIMRERRRTSNAQPWPEWEKQGKEPYHEYVHSLVEAGWGNLRSLDAYMNTDLEDPDLVVSVLDITMDGIARRHEDMHSETELSTFLQGGTSATPLNGGKPSDVIVRLYMVEQEGALASGIIEAFGCGLKLDPRFFAWHLFGSGRVLEPSQRHRAPYTSLGFTVLKKPERPRSTETEFFKVSIYLKPDEGGGEGWTAVLLFSSHAKLLLGMNQMRAPPEYGSILPEPAVLRERTFRELYLSTFCFIDLYEAARSPLYCLQYLFKLNGHCWNEVLSAIREEDKRIDGISEASVSHVEDLRKTFAIIQRGISQSWPRCDTKLSKDAKACLEEDFKHVLNQADLLWQNRDKMATVRQKKRDTRISTLTNAFTYIFAPISLVTGIYGMNVEQINGSPPGIWQFFVATASLIGLMLITFMGFGYVHIGRLRQRRARFWETVRFALGKKY